MHQGRTARAEAIRLDASDAFSFMHNRAYGCGFLLWNPHPYVHFSDEVLIMKKTVLSLMLALLLIFSVASAEEAVVAAVNGEELLYSE